MSDDHDKKIAKLDEVVSTIAKSNDDFWKKRGEVDSIRRALSEEWQWVAVDRTLDRPEIREGLGLKSKQEEEKAFYDEMLKIALGKMVGTHPDPIECSRGILRRRFHGECHLKNDQNIRIIQEICQRPDVREYLYLDDAPLDLTPRKGAFGYVLNIF